MSPIGDLFSSKSSRFWTSILIQAGVIALVIVALSWLFWAVALINARNPPVEIIALDPIDLGSLCPGEVFSIHNHVKVIDSSILVYYISILDPSESFNYPGTQVVLSGYQHPHASSFEQVILWQVPNLEDGDYIRSFAGRGTVGTEKAVFVKSRFSIEKEKCP